MLPNYIIPWPNKDDMNGMRSIGETPEGAYAVRIHPDGTKTFLTKQQYEELWQLQKQ